MAESKICKYSVSRFARPITPILHFEILKFVAGIYSW